MQSVNGLWRAALLLLLGFIAFELYRIDQSLRWVAAPIKGLSALAERGIETERSQTQAEWERARAEDVCRYVGQLSGPDEAKKCREKIKSSTTSRPSPK